MTGPNEMTSNHSVWYILYYMLQVGDRLEDYVKFRMAPIDDFVRPPDPMTAPEQLIESS